MIILPLYAYAFCRLNLFAVFVEVGLTETTLPDCEFTTREAYPPVNL